MDIEYESTSAFARRTSDSDEERTKKAMKVTPVLSSHQFQHQTIINRFLFPPPFLFLVLLLAEFLARH